MLAWKSGLKGITIYRNNSARGSIVRQQKKHKVQDRPVKLDSATYKIPYIDRNFYITVAGSGFPHEIFITSKTMPNWEFTSALAIVLSDYFQLLSTLEDKEKEKYIEDIIEDLSSIKTVPSFFQGHTLYSPVHTIALALSYYVNNKEFIKDRNRIAVDIQDGKIYNLYGDFNGERVPDDLTVRKCPFCGSEIAINLKEADMLFSCTMPCPVCGRSDRCE